MNEKNKTVLVTGGAGYAGSTLAGVLLKSGYNVLVLDCLKFGGESLLGLWHWPSFKFINADITSSDSLKQVFLDYEFDTVVHLAAIVGDPACSRQPELARAVNLKAALSLLECSQKKNIKKFIFASTCSNYGKMSDPTGYVDETSKLSPVSLYAELKVAFEKVLLDPNSRKEGFSPTVLRFSTVYGVSPRMRFDLTVNEFTKELALGRKLKVFGEQFWRPYCHVQDFSRAICRVLEAKNDQVAYQVFNVGDTGQNYQKLMIIDEIKKYIPKAQVEFVKKDEDPRDYRVSFEKIKNQLGFKVSMKLPDGIKEVINLIENRIIKDPDHGIYKN